MASLSQDSSSRVTSGRKVSSVARRARAEARQKKKAMGEEKGRKKKGGKVCGQRAGARREYEAQQWCGGGGDDENRGGDKVTICAVWGWWYARFINFQRMMNEWDRPVSQGAGSVVTAQWLPLVRGPILHGAKCSAWMMMVSSATTGRCVTSPPVHTRTAVSVVQRCAPVQSQAGEGEDQAGQVRSVTPVCSSSLLA